MPVEVSGGETLTGARMVFRAAPGRTAESLKQVIDCQLASGVAAAQMAERYTQFSYCPLTIKGVTAEVHTVAGYPR